MGRLLQHLSRRAILCGLSAGIAAGVVSTAGAQSFPSRAITIVVPFAPGGGTDILARLLAKDLEQKLGQAAVVENRPGAGGIIAAQSVIRAPADGYTLFFGTGTQFAVAPSLYKKLPFDPPRDFTPLALVAGSPFALVVHPSIPVKTVAEFIEYAKTRPGKLSYGTSGPGAPHHLFMELFNSRVGLTMTMVPYKGSIPALNDVVAGHLPLMMVDLGPAAGMLEAGKVRPLGVTTTQRVEGWSHIPPIADTLPGFNASGWFMMVAPRNLAAQPRDRLHAAFTEILAQRHIREAIIKAGFNPLETRSVADLQKFMASEIEVWRDMVRRAGVEGSF